MGKFDQALKLYQQALSIYKENNYKIGIAFSLNNIGRVYESQGKYNQALESQQQALTNYREVSDRAGEGVTISNLGQVYQKQGQLAKALELYQQAIAIHKEVGDRVNEATTLKYIGDLFAAQNKLELAITFYKQSVNLTESIRTELRQVSIDIQKSYAEAIAERYRRLADVLLKRNRPAEAQQVLDLLKIQEANDYLQATRGSSKKPQVEKPQVPLKPQETEISQKYSSIQDLAIAIGKELTALRKIPPSNRTAAQQQRIAELVKLESQITAEFNKLISSPEVVALVQQLSTTSGQENLNLRQLNALRDNLRKLDRKAVLLYPLILKDRLELVIVTADAPPIHRPVAVKEETLKQAVEEYRILLQTPRKDATEIARQLYDWLIKPIENDLKQVEAQTIIYAPDRELRYIPLAALHDGQQWLVQRYQINNITAASLTDFNTKPQKSLQILAAAFTTGDYNVTVGEQREAFRGLAFALKEVQNIAATIPGTKILLDKAFSPAATVPQMNDYNIVHFATHATLVYDNPKDSLILFGNGETVSIAGIENWSLPNVDLVVLSACQTGLGGKLGNGNEILGLGYQVQLAGAKAAIASLWTVDDGGTQALMNAFYAALQAENATKAEALRKAQVALITGDYSGLGQQRGLAIKERTENTVPKTVSDRLSHPYYWAPFILIGNGL